MYFPSLQEFPLAVIRGQECHCGYPTERFPLHEGADGQLCSEGRSEGKYCLVYQTPVQGTAPASRARARPTTAANGPAPLPRWVKAIRVTAGLATMIGVTLQAGI